MLSARGSIHGRAALAALACSGLLGCQLLIGLDEVGPRAQDPMAGSSGAPSAGSGASTGGTPPAGTGGVDAASGTSATTAMAGSAACDESAPLIDTPTVPPIPVVAAAQPPSIDGEPDDVWCTSRVFEALLETGDAPANFVARGRSLWDDKRLYLRFEVVDDVLYQDGFFWYEDDHVWVGLDPTPGGATGDELLFGFTPTSRDLQDFESWPNYDRTRLLLAQSQAGDTFTFEVSMPWDLLPDFVPAGQSKLGFELRVRNTNDGSAFASLSWANADEPSDEAPTSWGRLVLQAKP